jgi:hypothetical protein
MSKVIIYGTGDKAEIGHYFLQNSSEHFDAEFCVEYNYVVV